MLCPYAMELLWHGSTPLDPPSYPTADESKALHSKLASVVWDALVSPAIKVLSFEREYEQKIGIVKGEDILCARSRADAVYTISVGDRVLTLYVEVSSSRINVAKPWQALLRGIALYYERRIPVGIIIVSPETIMYKLVDDRDQVKILSKTVTAKKEFRPRHNLCSLCELRDYCPYRAI